MLRVSVSVELLIFCPMDTLLSPSVNCRDVPNLIFTRETLVISDYIACVSLHFPRKYSLLTDEQ